MSSCTPFHYAILWPEKRYRCCVVQIQLYTEETWECDHRLLVWGSCCRQVHYSGSQSIWHPLVHPERSRCALLQHWTGKNNIHKPIGRIWFARCVYARWLEYTEPKARGTTSVWKASSAKFLRNGLSKDIVFVHFDWFRVLSRLLRDFQLNALKLTSCQILKNICPILKNRCVLNCNFQFAVRSKIKALKTHL